MSSRKEEVLSSIETFMSKEVLTMDDIRKGIRKPNAILRSVAVVELKIGMLTVDEVFNKYQKHPAMLFHFMLSQIIQDYNIEKLKGKKNSKKMMDAILQFKVALEFRDKKTAEEKVSPCWLKYHLPYHFYDKEISDCVPIEDDEFMPDHLSEDWNDEYKAFLFKYGI